MRETLLPVKNVLQDRKIPKLETMLIDLSFMIVKFTRRTKNPFKKRNKNDFDEKIYFRGSCSVEDPSWWQIPLWTKDNLGPKKFTGGLRKAFGKWG